MKIYKPPEKPQFDHRKSVFLAGTIDNGLSEDWQSQVQKELDSYDILILNPRREAWDASWEQSIHNPMFREQVEWELDGLDKSSLIFVHFAGGSKSPITLMELGLYAASGKVIVSCASDFWRRGNVEVVCHRYNIPLYASLSDALSALKQALI